MFSGLMTALVTPFDEEGGLDLRATEAVLERHIEAGVDGIVALGSTGEFSHLEGSERRYFAEKVAEIIGGRVPLVVGIGTSGTREGISLARHAESTGADAVVAVAPFYWKVGEEALFRHFATISEATAIPTMIYNFPMLTGIDLSPALVRRLAEECPNVVGIKDTVTEYMHTVNVLQAVKPVRRDFTVMVGFEDQILPSLLAGSDGSICGLSNVAPGLFVSLVRAFEENDLEEAAKLHRRVLNLMSLGAQSDPPIGAIKLAMRKLGVPISPTVRGPALPATDEEGVNNVLKAAGLLAAARGPR
ncbi:MAG: dihydrodipicolinate synthase family protein [Rubrobacteraceae bacterium]